jgi:CRP-like cAMP-binding protein
LPENKIAQTFAAMDALAFAGVIVGSVVAPLLVRGFGLSWALVLAGLSGPAATIACSPWLRNVDRRARRRVEALRPTMRLLARSSVFGGASSASLEMLAASLTGVRIETGGYVVRRGEPATGLYVVVDGTLTVRAGDAGPVLSVLGPGDFFGEVGILDGIARTASVRAETTCSLFRIGATEFLGVINKSPMMRGRFIDVARLRIPHAQAPLGRGREVIRLESAATEVEAGDRPVPHRQR